MKHDHKQKELAGELTRLMQSTGIDRLLKDIENGEISTSGRCAINRLARVSNELRERVNMVGDGGAL